jgi:hypothetical protein
MSYDQNIKNIFKLLISIVNVKYLYQSQCQIALVTNLAYLIQTPVYSEQKYLFQTVWNLLGYLGL